MIEIGAAITAICALIAAYLKARSEGKPAREEKKRENEAQEINRMVAEADVDAAAARIADIRRRLHERDNLSQGKQ